MKLSVLSGNQMGDVNNKTWVCISDFTIYTTYRQSVPVKNEYKACLISNIIVRFYHYYCY